MNLHLSLNRRNSWKKVGNESLQYLFRRKFYTPAEIRKHEHT